MALVGVWWGSYTFAAGAMVGIRPIFLTSAFAPVIYCEEGWRTISMPGSIGKAVIIPLPPTRVVDH